MSTVIVYKSTDGSAPTLSGTAGDLITVLNACLVTGYGSKAAAGWSKPYTGTNGAVYRQGGGNQFYLNVNDNGPGAGTGKEARVFGAESMTAFGTGTNLFPTAAQAANGQFVRKSTTADATTRPWIVIADDRTFYMFVQTGDVASVWMAWGFGDIYSLLPTIDGYRTILIARQTENVATGGGLENISSSGTSTVAGTYMARSHTQIGGSIAQCRWSDYVRASTSLPGSGNCAYPSGVTNKIELATWNLSDASCNVRGRLRGLQNWCHAVGSIADGDTFSGDGGKTFLCVKGFIGSATNSCYILETSSTWETN